LKIWLFGDGAWAASSLVALRDRGHRVEAVVLRTRPSDDSLETMARSSGIPVHGTESVNAASFVSLVQQSEPDLCVSIAYNQIFRRPILEAARLGYLNFHAGKLPLYRGRNVVNWAIINGESEIGLTAHFIDEGIDTGDVVLQTMLPILWTDSYQDVLCRVVSRFPSFVSEAVEQLAAGSALRVPQRGPSTYFCGREEADEWLNWSDTSRNLYNKIRGISHPAPGARTVYSSRAVRVWKAVYDPSWPGYIATPGQVVGRHSEGCFIKTGDSILLVTLVQVDGDNASIPMWPIGTRLGIDTAALLQAAMNGRR
jgi:methionyl-tRNA formyltransferase